MYHHPIHKAAQMIHPETTPMIPPMSVEVTDQDMHITEGTLGLQTHHPAPQM